MEGDHNYIRFLAAPTNRLSAEEHPTEFDMEETVVEETVVQETVGTNGLSSEALSIEIDVEEETVQTVEVAIPNNSGETRRIVLQYLSDRHAHPTRTRSRGRPRETLNIDLACLNVETEPGTPSRPNKEELVRLTSVGLGYPATRKTPFACNKPVVYVRERLMQVFPRLIEGKFSLFKTCKGKTLKKIDFWETLKAEEMKKCLNRATLIVLPQELRPLETPENQSNDPLVIETGTPTVTFRARLMDHSPAEVETRPAGSPTVHLDRMDNSPAEVETRPAGSPTINPDQMLKNIKDRLRPAPENSGKIIVNIHNDLAILNQTCAAFEGQDLRRLTSVKWGEQPGIDNEGLSRQLRMCLVRELKSSRIFQGEEHSKHLRHDASYLEQGYYKKYGAIIAYVIAHGGPYPAFMSSKLYDEVRGVEVEYSIDEIPDRLLRSFLQKLEDSNTDEELLEAHTLLNPYIQCAHAQDLMTLEKKGMLARALKTFVTKTLLSECLRDFRKGLEELNVLETIIFEPDLCKHFLLNSHQPPLTADSVLKLWEINAFTDEHKIVAEHFKQFIRDAGESTLKKLLIFASGQDTIPIGGFDWPTTPTVSFKVQQPGASDFRRELEMCPESNACSILLKLPVITNYSTFSFVMNQALDNPEVFDLY